MRTSHRISLILRKAVHSLVVAGLPSYTVVDSYGTVARVLTRSSALAWLAYCSPRAIVVRTGWFNLRSDLIAGRVFHKAL